MAYSFIKYYQAYLCAYDKTRYTAKSYKKKLSLIFNKYCLLLILPVFFALLVIIDFDSHRYKNQTSLNPLLHIYKKPINVHMDFDPSNDSTKINSLYSQKIIEDDFFTNPKMRNNFEKKLAKKMTKTVISFTETIISDSRINIIKISDTNKPKPIQVASTNWKNNFSKKKVKFISTLLPLISYQNQKIIVERKRLFEIYYYLDLQKTLHKNDIIFLEHMAKKYLINSKNIHKIDLIERLLQSVDIIPNSIVLAQAANESGWGSSRFAKEYNALFGQYTYDEKNGVVPFRREEGERYLIRNFSSIDKSVESYFKNINTHYAYEKFRDMRSAMNKNNLGLNIKLLTECLDVYAKDEFYVETINSIIETNNFTQFDLKNHFFVNS